jgi:hypothetical protein
MKDPKKSTTGLNRRDALKVVTAAGLGLAAGGLGSSSVFAQASVSETRKQNRIQKENAKPGTRDWQLAKTRQTPGKINPNLANGRCPWIEGYCSANSIRAGETLKVMVSTNPASSFKLEIFRTGYYNGDGGRLMRTFDDLEGIAQPEPSVGENFVHGTNGNMGYSLTDHIGNTCSC